MAQKCDCLGKTALVTGASSGIGLEFSRQLAAGGADVVLVSNQQKELEEIRNSLALQYPEQRFYACYKDLSTPDCADYLLEYCHANDITADIVINNAGIFAFKEVTDMSAAHLNLFVDLHMRAVTMICRVFAEDMKTRGGGYILNMSSMSCWMPMPGIAMYSATKSYIQVLSRSMYYELRDSGVSVTVACPGGIATDLFGLPKKLQKFAVNIGVLATPKSFVKGALKRMLKRKPQYVNGLLNKFSVFLVPKLPTCVKMLVKYKLLDKMKNNAA